MYTHSKNSRTLMEDFLNALVPKFRLAHVVIVTAVYFGT